MSRIRIVKGTITKTTGGDHNIYSEGNIVYNSGTSVCLTSDVGITYGEPKDAPKRAPSDFDITLELDKQTKSIVPFGILDFNNNAENPYFSFKYKLSKSKIDSLSFEILDENDSVIYQMNYLEPVIVQASKKVNILSEARNPVEGQLISKTWDYNRIYGQYTLLESEDYTQIGDYYIHWDGFDNDGIYDSTRFNNKKLKAKITATKDGIHKQIIEDFATQYSQVEWTDVKIDKNAKRIDVTLRVNLTDGGAEGLSCQTINANIYGMPARTVCDWDKIPASEIKKWGKIPIRTRTKNFQDLINLAISGLNYHWGRNKNHAEAKDVKMFGESYELFMNSTVSQDKAIGELKLIYNTNGNWARSGNPGTIKDPLSAAGNVFSRQAICYNVGYIYSLDWHEFYKKNNWRYREEFDEIIEFKETSAHEIGHEILKKYGGTLYSYGHKGTVNPIFQEENSNAIPHPIKGEIDLMPYFTDWLDYSKRKRIAASEKDALSLIWLTKLSIR